MDLLNTAFDILNLLVDRIDTGMNHNSLTKYRNGPIMAYSTTRPDIVHENFVFSHMEIFPSLNI